MVIENGGSGAGVAGRLQQCATGCSAVKSGLEVYFGFAIEENVFSSNMDLDIIGRRCAFVFAGNAAGNIS